MEEKVEFRHHESSIFKSTLVTLYHLKAEKTWLCSAEHMMVNLEISSQLCNDKSTLGSIDVCATFFRLMFPCCASY